LTVVVEVEVEVEGRREDVEGEKTARPEAEMAKSIVAQREEGRRRREERRGERERR
jgi:hypothetical protein